MRLMLSCLGLRDEMARRHKDHQAKLDPSQTSGKIGCPSYLHTHTHTHQHVKLPNIEGTTR